VQQTAVAVVNVTKDLDVDADLETTLVSGLSYSSYSVAETALVLAVADADATIAVSGLSYFFYSVAETLGVLTVADADATICAANC